MTVGTKRQVWNGTATKTKGGLTKSDLMRNPSGRIVSKRASAAAKQSKNLGGFQKVGSGGRHQIMNMTQFGPANDPETKRRWKEYNRTQGAGGGVGVMSGPRYRAEVARRDAKRAEAAAQDQAAKSVKFQPGVMSMRGWEKARKDVPVATPAQIKQMLGRGRRGGFRMPNIQKMISNPKKFFTPSGMSVAKGILTFL